MEMLGKNKDYHKDTCENCKYKFNCYGLVGGQAICNRCYDLWSEQHILKEEIKELKEENEKLQDENNHFKISMIKSTNEKYDEWKEDTENYVIKSLKEENEKLQDENNELNEANIKLTNDLYMKNSSSHACDKQIITELKKLHIEETKVKYPLLKEISEYKKIIKSLKKENEKFENAP